MASYPIAEMQAIAPFYLPKLKAAAEPTVVFNRSRRDRKCMLDLSLLKWVNQGR